MKKSILRFGALALMSMMSIGAFAEKGDVFYVDGHKFSVLEEASADASGKAKLVMVKSGVGVNLSGDITLSETQKKYTVTEVAEDACYYVGASTEITLPSVIKIGDHAFANKDVKVTFAKPENAGKYTLGSGSTIGKYAFEGAKIGGTTGCTYDFSEVTLPEGAFKDATFVENGSGVTIEMGEATSLADYVFGTTGGGGISDIQSIVFDFPSKQFTTVGKFALKGRTGLKHFGYKESEGSYWLPVGLEKVGESAFAGCSNINEFAFTLNAKDSGIKSVGKNAFQGCSWLNDEKFANSFRSFATLSFAEGSFQGCSLTSVDLTNWNTIDVTIGEDEEEQTLKGIPANAFAGNPITALKYPKELQAIGTKAFEGNRLETISLPEGLLYVGENALKSANKTEEPAAKFIQVNLYLPKSLKQIFAGGIDNREITNIYAWPTLKEGEVTYIPTIGAHTALKAALTIPVIAPYKTTGASPTITSKTLYSDAGWKSENLTTNFSVQYPQKGTFTWGYGGVTYAATTDAQDATYGYYTVKVTGFEATEDRQDEIRLNPVIYGFIQAESEQDYAKFGDYVYDVVCKVTFPEACSNNYIKTATLTPNAGYKTLSDEFAKFFKDDQTFTKYTLPVDAFKEDKNLTSVTFGTGITAIPDEAFYGCTKLSTVNFDTNAATEGVQSEITSIGEYAFAGTTKLESIDLPSGLTSVGAGAFSDLAGSTGVEARPAGLKSVTLPNNLGTIASSAFAAESIEKVYVSYASVPTLLADPFAYKSTQDQNHYKADLIVTGGDKYLRSDYLVKDYWKKFFKHNTGTFTEVFASESAGGDDVEKTVCADEEGVFHFADEVKAVKVTAQIGTPASIEGDAKPVKVSYSRDLAEGLWNPISLPFDVKASDIKDAEVAELYNVRLNPDTGALEAVVWVKLKDADAVMTARTPYVIRPAEGKGTGWTLTTESVIEKTFGHYGDDEEDYYLNGLVDCSTTKERYTIQSNFETVASLKGVYGYYISGSGFSYDNTSNGLSLSPYRFYMTRFDRVNYTTLYGGFGDPYDPNAPQSGVKVVVLDDEEEAATYINSLSVRDAENLSAPMYDVTGRQIASPIKGQVYIQNGVKKLAK